MTQKRETWFDVMLYYLIFLGGAIVAGFHTYQVNLQANPPFIALLSALTVDGLLAYTMHSVRRWTGSKQQAAAVGITLFGVVSATSQVISYRLSTGQVLEPWLAIVATYIIPIASGTGSFVTAALIQLFDKDKNGVPDFLERNQKQKGQNQPAFPASQQMSQYNPHPASVPNQFRGQGGGKGNQRHLPQPARVLPETQIGSPAPNGNGRKFDNTLGPVGELTQNEPRKGSYPTTPQP